MTVYTSNETQHHCKYIHLIMVVLLLRTATPNENRKNKNPAVLSIKETKIHA